MEFMDNLITLLFFYVCFGIVLGVGGIVLGVCVVIKSLWLDYMDIREVRRDRARGNMALRKYKGRRTVR